MQQPNEPNDTVERREQSAQHVLHAYRERRRRRRDGDTYFGSVDCLTARTEAEVEPAELQHRRSDILEEADEAGMSPELAELLYDVARDEGLDPALAFELVKTGLGVVPPDDGLSNAPSVPTTDKYLPPWMFPPTPTDKLLRERMLRVSFRRLLALLEEHEDAAKAFNQFANEPDVGHFGY
jgi:hypothetical protein